MTVTRFVTLLILLALVFTNGPAVAMAMCQHNDASAHAAALLSSDASVSSEAQAEETAAKGASKQGFLGDAATTLLAGFMLPPEPAIPSISSVASVAVVGADPPEMIGGSVRPLLEPPLA